MRAVSRRCSRRLYVLVLLAMVGLLFGFDSSRSSNVAMSGGMQEGLHDADDRGGVAPEWPFAGIIAPSLTGLGYRGLDYRNARTGETSHVDALWARGARTQCDIYYYTGPEGVVIAAPLWLDVKIPLSDGQHFEIQYADLFQFIPWSDAAYPLFMRPDFVGEAIGYRSHQGRFGITLLNIERMTEFDWEAQIFQLRLGSRERIYSVQEFDLPEDVGEESLYWPYLSTVTYQDDVIERLEEQGDLRFRENPGHVGWGARIIGTDGRHYLLQWTFTEPACQYAWIFVVEGHTGKIVACGAGHRASSLAIAVPPEPEWAIPADWSLPQPVTPSECSQRTLEEFLS